MKTLKYFALAGLFIFGLTTANAQDSDSKRMNKKPKKYDMSGYHKMQDSTHFHKQWAKEVELSKEQREQIKNIRAKRADKIKKLRGEMRELRKAQREEIQGVFTPEQKEKMKEMRSKRRDQMKKNRKNRGHWGKRHKSRR